MQEAPPGKPNEASYGNFAIPILCHDSKLKTPSTRSTRLFFPIPLFYTLYMFYMAILSIPLYTLYTFYTAILSHPLYTIYTFYTAILPIPQL